MKRRSFLGLLAGVVCTPFTILRDKPKTTFKSKFYDLKSYGILVEKESIVFVPADYPGLEVSPIEFYNGIIEQPMFGSVPMPVFTNKRMAIEKIAQKRVVRTSK